MIHKRNEPSTDAARRVRSPEVGISFLLSQLGAHAASRFGELLTPLGIEPHHAGILRMLSVNPGLTQQALSELFGVFPSRLVQLLDELQVMGLIERRTSPSDRRIYLVQLTVDGAEKLKEVQKVTRKLDQEMERGLDRAERDEFERILRTIVLEQRITPAVHPSYRKRLDRPVAAKRQKREGKREDVNP